MGRGSGAGEGRGFREEGTLEPSLGDRGAKGLETTEWAPPRPVGGWGQGPRGCVRGWVPGTDAGPSGAAEGGAWQGPWAERGRGVGHRRAFPQVPVTKVYQRTKGVICHDSQVENLQEERGLEGFGAEAGVQGSQAQEGARETWDAV